MDEASVSAQCALGTCLVPGAVPAASLEHGSQVSQLRARSRPARPLSVDRGREGTLHYWAAGNADLNFRCGKQKARNLWGFSRSRGHWEMR